MKSIRSNKEYLSQVFASVKDIHLSDSNGSESMYVTKSLLVRTMGRFYTPEFIVANLADITIRGISLRKLDSFRVADPFCGDGRLVVALLNRARELGISHKTVWHVSLWDCDSTAVQEAASAVVSAARKACIRVRLDTRCQDSLLALQSDWGSFDCVITNPPWETLKPDSRETAGANGKKRTVYLRALKMYDQRLAMVLPLSQPRRKFSGWGTNLSRCGTEVAFKLLKHRGICSIVIPPSLLTDQSSSALREWMWKNVTFLDVCHYPASPYLECHPVQPHHAHYGDTSQEKRVQYHLRQ